MADVMKKGNVARSQALCLGTATQDQRMHGKLCILVDTLEERGQIYEQARGLPKLACLLSYLFI